MNRDLADCSCSARYAGIAVYRSLTAFGMTMIHRPAIPSGAAAEGLAKRLGSVRFNCSIHTDELGGVMCSSAHVAALIKQRVCRRCGGDVALDKRRYNWVGGEALSSRAE